MKKSLRWTKYGFIFIGIILLMACTLIFSLTTQANNDFNKYAVAEGNTTSSTSFSSLTTNNLGSYESNSNSTNTKTWNVSFSGNVANANAVGNLTVSGSFKVKNNKAGKTQTLEVYNGSTRLNYVETSGNGYSDAVSFGATAVPAGASLTVKMTCRGGKVALVGVVGGVENIKITIGFSAPSGSVSSSSTTMGTVSPSSYSISSLTGSQSLSATANTGYRFTGWSGTNASSSASFTLYGYSAHGNYTANFAANTYTIAVNANGADGGSMSAPSLTASSAQTASTSVTYGTVKNIYNFKSLTRTGYTYAGVKMSGGNASTAKWNYYHKDYGDGSGGSGVADKALSNDTLFAQENGDVNFLNLNPTNGSTVTFTVQWTANQYTVTLNNNGGSGGTGSVTATYDSAMPSATMPTRTGYTFQGYYDTNAASGGTQYYTAAGASTRAWNKTAATTLYARWTANTYTVTLNKNSDAATAGTASVTGTYDSAMPSATMPSRTGYTFAGYYDTSAASGGTQYYTAAGASARTWNKTAATTLYARWTANTYTVTLDKNGGTTAGTASVTATYDSAMPIAGVDMPSKTGYTFQGYYDTSAASGGTQYYTSSGASARTWNKASATTLYARWAVTTYTIKFDGQSATSAGTTSTTATYGATPSSITVPTRTGYTFGGYYTRPNGAGNQLFTDAGVAVGNYTGRLPSGYQQVEWLKSTSGGGQYIATGIYPTSKTAIEVVAKMTTPYSIFGVNANVHFNVTGSTGSGTLEDYFYWGSSSPTADKTSAYAYTKTTYGLDQGKAYRNGTLRYTFTNSFAADSTVPMALFGRINSSGQLNDNSEIYIYGCKIWENGVLVRDYLPCKRTSDNVLGLYDVLNGEFKTNAGSGTFVAGGPDVPTETFTLYAKWTANTYTVTYDANQPNATNSVSGVPTDTSNWTYDANHALGSAPSLTGWTFKGWYKEAACTNKVGDAGATATKPNLTATNNGTAKLYAKWEANTYTVTLNNQSGSGAASITVTYDSAMPSVTKPTKAGYTFGGYFTDVGGGGTQYYNATPASVKNWTTLGGGTFYAKWTFTISYNQNLPTEDPATHDGYPTASVTNWPSNPTFIYNHTNTLAAAPSITGWTFGGWYLDAACTSLLGNANTTITAAKSTELDASAGSEVVYAKWTAITYTAKYDKNTTDSVFAMPSDPTGIWIYDNYVTLSSSSPTRTGYTFKGWYRDAAGTSKIGDPGDSVKANVTSTNGATAYMYAKWQANVYTVSYNGNLSDGMSAATKATLSGVPTNTHNCTYGTAFNLSSSAPSLAGWEFVGWYKNAAGTGDRYDAGQNVNNVSATNNDAVVLYAAWRANPYVVTYSVTKPATAAESNVMTNVPSGNYNQTYDTDFSLATAPVLNGYVFDGWFVGDTLIGMGAATVRNLTATKNATVTLTAHWHAKQSTITFVQTGATVSGTDTLNVTFDQNMADITVPTRTGYTFGGYYTQNGGNGDKYFGTDGKAVAEYKLCQLTSDLTLHAAWTANKYTITFNKAGGNGGSDSVLATYDAALPAANAPAKNGYSFSGYYTGENGAGTVYYNNTMAAQPALYNLVADDITLYAKWTIINYNIIYDTTGGTEGAGNPATYNIETATFTVVPPTRWGYNFAGWTDNSGNSRSATVTQGTYGDLAFNANWTAIEYNVNYVLNDDLTYTGTETKLSPATNNGFNVSKYTVETNNITFREPTRTGYTFGGWYADDGLATSITGITKGSRIGDVTIYAKWTEISYNITYVLDGGDNDEGNPASYTIESAFAFINPTKTAFTSTGWHYDPSGADEALSGIVQGSTGDITIYAGWTPTPYTISYDFNGGAFTAESQDIYDADVEYFTVYDYYSIVDFTSLYAEKTAYNFLYWCSDAGLTTPIYFIEEGSYGNKTLYAKYEPITYDITYYTNGGTNHLDNEELYQHYNVETPDITLGDASKAGYTFDDWYLDASLAEQYKVNHTIVGSYAITYGNINLYANYTPIEYDIVYVLNGGTNHVNNPSKYTIEDEFDFESPTKAGYNFLNWYADPDFYTRYDGIARGTFGSTVTVYAKYQFSDPTLTGSDINSEYTGSDISLTVGVNHGLISDEHTTVVYTWTGGYTASEQRTATYPVRNVSDSGDYTVTVVVKYDDDDAGIHETSNPIVKYFTVTISRATITATTPTFDITYGDVVTFSATYTGFKGTDTKGVIKGGSATYSTSYEQGDNVGSYAYSSSVAGLTADNYVFETSAGTFNVIKRNVTVSVDNAENAYDGLNQTTTYTVSPAAFYGRETISATLTYKEGNTVVNERIDVGSWTVEATANYDATNFAVTTVPGTLTIVPAELHIVAVPSPREYRDGAERTGSWEYRFGLGAGDALDDSGIVLMYQIEGVWGYVGPGEINEDPGYQFKVVDFALAAGSRAKSNYYLTTEEAKLTIGRVPITIVVSNISSGLVYDGQVKTTNYTAYLLEGDTLTCDLIYTKDSYTGDAINAGTWDVTVDISSIVLNLSDASKYKRNAGGTDYVYDVTAGSLVIDPATVSFNIASDTVVYDGTAKTVGQTAIGLYGTDEALAVLSYSDNVNVGTCTVSVASASITSGVATNYVFDLSATNTLTITPLNVYGIIDDVNSGDGEVYDGYRHFTTAHVEDALGNEITGTSFTFTLAYGNNISATQSMATRCPVTIESYAAEDIDLRNYNMDISDTGYMWIDKADYDFSATTAYLESEKVNYHFSAVYNRNPQTPKFNVRPRGADGSIPDIFFTEGPTNVNEGAKPVTVTFASTSDNYNNPTIVYNVYMSITKYKLVPIWVTDEEGYISLVYSAGLSTPQAHTVDLEGNWIDLVVTNEAGAKDVREDAYSAYASFDDDDLYPNYTLTDIMTDFYIIPREITVRFTVDRLVYDGTEKSVEPVAVGAIRGDEVNFNVSYSDVPVNAGSYVATATLPEGNYVLTGTNTVDFTIERRTARVVAKDLTSVYGEDIKSTDGEYTQDGFVPGDAVTVVITKEDGDNVGAYDLTPYVDSDNYIIRTVKGTYTITPAPVTVFIKDRTQTRYNSFALTAKQGTNVNDGDWYVSDGILYGGDDLGVTLHVEVEQGQTETKIIADWDNDNYYVTFTGSHTDGDTSYASYRIILKQAYLTIPEDFVFNKIYDGVAVSIPVKNTSGGKINAFVNGVQVRNSFVEPGTYVITFQGLAREQYYAPEDITVTYIIYPKVVEAKAEGVTIKSYDSETGFAVDATITVTADSTQAARASSEMSFFKKVDNFYVIEVTDGELGNVLELDVGKNYKDGEVITVCLYNGTSYETKQYTVHNGSITIEDASNLKGVGIVADDQSKSMLIIFVAVAAGLFVMAMILGPIILRGRR